MKSKIVHTSICTLCLVAFVSLLISCNHTIREINEGGDDNVFNPGNEKQCVNGISQNIYPCRNIDLLAVLSPAELLGERLNDIWGWTDPETGDEYAIAGLTDGVTFVNVTDPQNPVVIGELVESVSNDQARYSDAQQHDDEKADDEKSTWRDFKVYRDYLYVVSDGQPHGMQVFDLARLRNHDGATKVSFSEDFLYQGFESAHNIAVNEETGFAYVVGSGEYGGGLLILDISSPLQPQFAGFHSDSTVGRRSTGYVHDTQCVVYEGPDSDYFGRELCFNSSETHFVIADVTRKDSTFTAGKSGYPGQAYAHQGWLTEDHRYFLLDDELDERNTFGFTKTYIWDVRDVENPALIGTYESANGTIDHNQYIKGNYSYQANYTAGLRVLDLSNIASGELTEAAHFDTYPEDNSVTFNGAWSTYPFFQSGIVIVSDTNNGLFILQPDI